MYLSIFYLKFYKFPKDEFGLYCSYDDLHLFYLLNRLMFFLKYFNFIFYFS